MNASEVREQLINWTVLHSGHDATRRYLGMSRIAECPHVLYHEVIDGPAKPNPAQYLTFYAGYLWERDIKQRLEEIGIYAPMSERLIVCDFDPRFYGHSDGETTGGRLLEIKSTVQVNLEEISANKRIPRRHFQQVQMYLHHGKYPAALMVYVARDTGQIHTAEIRPMRDVAEDLNRKARMILAAVDAGRAPACECGRCTLTP